MSRPRSTSRCARRARRCTPPLGREPRPVRFVVSLRLGEPPTLDPVTRAPGALPVAALQARPHHRVDARAHRRARGHRRGRLGRLQGPLRRLDRRPARRPRPLPPRRRGLPRRLDRGPQADRGDRRDPPPPPRPHHLGRAHPRRRRHRGPALPAANGQRQAVAPGAAALALRRLRVLRDARHRDVRRRPVRARPRPRPHPVPGLGLPPRHPQRRGARRLQRPRRRRRGCRTARWSRWRTTRAFAGASRAYTYVGCRPVDDRSIVATWNSACRATSPSRRSSTARSTATPSSGAPPSSPTARSACRPARSTRCSTVRSTRGSSSPASRTSKAGASAATTPSPRSVARELQGEAERLAHAARTVTRRLRVTATAVTP